MHHMQCEYKKQKNIENPLRRRKGHPVFFRALRRRLNQDVLLNNNRPRPPQYGNRNPKESKLQRRN